MPERHNALAFSEQAGEQPGNKLFLETETSLTYAQLFKKIKKLTTLFAQASLFGGNRVVLASHRDQAVTELFLALLLNNITAVVIDQDSTRSEAQSIITKVNPHGIFIDETLWRDWGCTSCCDDECFRLMIGDTPSEPVSLLEKLLPKKKPAKDDTYPAVLENISETKPPQTIPGDSIAYMLFTSGTTSQPKGVEISVSALFTHIQTIGRQMGYSEDSRLLNVLPLSHADGLTQGPLIAFFHGASIFRPVHFSPQTMVELLDGIYRHRITHMIVVPTILALISRLGEEVTEFFSTPDYRLTLSAAAYLEKDLWETMERLTNHPVVNVYGLTETVTGSLFCGPDAATRKVGTLGKPVDCQTRIINDSGDTVTSGDTGELLIKGQHLMNGYYKNQEATDAVLKNGWLHTGDLVFQDDDGFFHYAGRKKNIIIQGGRNIIPEQIAEVLREHPGVAEAVAVGAPGDEWGELVAAYVIPESDNTPNEADLVSWCRKSLSSYKVPARIVTGEVMPRGRTGKILLEEVRTLVMREGRSDEEQTTAKEDVLKVASRIFKTPVKSLAGHSSSDDTAGWNSLGHMHFMAGLEKQFGITLTTREIISIKTLAQAISVIENRLSSHAPH